MKWNYDILKIIKILNLNILGTSQRKILAAAFKSSLSFKFSMKNHTLNFDQTTSLCARIFPSESKLMTLSQCNIAFSKHDITKLISQYFACQKSVFFGFTSVNVKVFKPVYHNCRDLHLG